MEQATFKTRFLTALRYFLVFFLVFSLVLTIGDFARASNYILEHFSIKLLGSFLLSMIGIYGLTTLFMSSIFALIWTFFIPEPINLQVRSLKKWFIRLIKGKVDEPSCGALFFTIFLILPLYFLMNFIHIKTFILKYNRAYLIALASAALNFLFIIISLFTGYLLYNLLKRFGHTRYGFFIRAKYAILILATFLLGFFVFAIAMERSIFKSLDGWAIYMPILGAVAGFLSLFFIDRIPEFKIFTRRLFRISIDTALILIIFIGFFLTSANYRVRPLLFQYSRNLTDVVKFWSTITDFDHDGYSFLFGENDCAPFNPKVHPGAFDIPGNGIDEDCFDGDLPKQLTKKYKPPILTHPYTHLKRPNVILFSIDACRRDAFGVYGAPPNRTPNVDKWAKDSIVFDDAVSEASWTMPSFASTMTGRYASEIPGYFGASKPVKIPSDIPTLAQVFHKAGYSTTAITSGLRLNELGLSRGFARWIHISLTPNGQYSVDVAKRAVLFLENYHGTKPLFLWVHCIDPHSPYIPPTKDKLFGKSSKGLYAAEVHFADRAFGILMSALKRLGYYDNTIMVLFADHGEAFGEHGKRFHGMSTYAEEIRIPFIWHIPGIKPTRIKGLVGLIDLAPTMFDLASINPPKDMILRGTSLATAIVKHSNAPLRDYLVEQTRYTQEFSLVTPKYQLRYDLSHNLFELFNRIKDPLEKTNIAFDRPDLFLKLRRRLVQKLLPILLATTNRISKVLLDKIPSNYRRIKGVFKNGLRIVALHLAPEKSSSKKAAAKNKVHLDIVFKTHGPLRGKHFYLIIKLRDKKGHVVARIKDVVTHNYYMPTMWRKNELVLHSTTLKSKTDFSNISNICIFFIVNKKALVTTRDKKAVCVDLK